ncbi:hypothetical protein BJV74DRAFT_142156 [Russula compacta]|nr:hypothetical protein BJV74DRAFT_142156 [Russula compacta]
MANNFSQNYAPKIVEGAVEVTGHIIGRSLIDGLRKSFTTSSQVEEGDYFMDQSRDLLQKHLQLIQLNEQTIIRHRYVEARDLKGKLDDQTGSKFQRYLQAKEYRRLSRKTYKIIKRASDRAIDDRLMDQIAEATRGPGDSPSTGPAASTPRDPFTDSHAISTLTNVAVNDVDEVEMTTYECKATGEVAAVLDVHVRDASTQHIVATCPTEVFSDDRTNREASQSAAPEGLWRLFYSASNIDRVLSTRCPKLTQRGWVYTTFRPYSPSQRLP